MSHKIYLTTLFALFYLVFPLKANPKNDSVTADINYIAEYYGEYAMGGMSDGYISTKKGFDRKEYQLRWNRLDISAVGRIAEMLSAGSSIKPGRLIVVAKDLMRDQRYLPGDYERMIAGVAKHLPDPDFSTQHNVLEFLFKYDGFNDAAAVLPLFRDNNFEVRQGAAGLLGKIGTLEILVEFEQMVKDREAKNTVANITGDYSIVLAKQAIKAIKTRGQGAPTLSSIAIQKPTPLAAPENLTKPLVKTTSPRQEAHSFMPIIWIGASVLCVVIIGFVFYKRSK